MASLPGSALGSRPELLGTGPRLLRLAALALAGGGAGALPLLLTPGTFGRIVAFLVAAASLVLLVQPRVAAWQERHPSRNSSWLPSCALLAVWVYDGYWGGGACTMALAVLLLTTDQRPAHANALKNVLLGAADIACSLVFVLYGPVRWAAAVPLSVGLMAGSAIGPSLTRRIPANMLRVVVALGGLGLAVHLWFSPS